MQLQNEAGYDYHQTRLSLERDWREKQLILNQEKRTLGRWWLTALVLVLVFAGGIAGANYLNSNWSYLSFLAGAGILAFLVGFISLGRVTLMSSWKHQTEIADIKNEQQILEEVWLQGLETQQYHQYYRQIVVPGVIEDYRQQSKVNRVLHFISQLTVIITSLLVTGLTSGLDTKLGWQIPWAAPLLSFIVSLITAIMGFFKFRERSYHMQQTADYIEQEKTALELGIRHYKEYRNKPDEAFSEFAERVEQSREEQTKRQQQLEQSTDTKEVA
ncbi:DUF4231 domain-containing protein [Dictyobacter aurantiacus]|uniref:DUF4231 domain-containing protein n=1 Tax=Dictyobacter aurantiacus TaxID=1936993 RepID=A0A401ZDD5_9CHLR|nr:DUF4231 domain-containing protein [Dictyobacter aurantiacus]GCE04708.1 hypothetical protein KDAU_20370 [Dictyobacter aurantiacus]